jgi:2-dehydropantoate 2-reductase
LDLLDQAMYDANQQMFWDMYQVALPGKASMLQDLEKGRATEVPMINGYVSEVGKKHGIPTPFNDAVVEIVRGIEQGQCPLSMENLSRFDDDWFTFAAYQPQEAKRSEGKDDV